MNLIKANIILVAILLSYLTSPQKQFRERFFTSCKSTWINFTEFIHETFTKVCEVLAGQKKMGSWFFPFLQVTKLPTVNQQNSPEISVYVVFKWIKGLLSCYWTYNQNCCFRKGVNLRSFHILLKIFQTFAFAICHQKQHHDSRFTIK